MSSCFTNLEICRDVDKWTLLANLNSLVRVFLSFRVEVARQKHPFILPRAEKSVGAVDDEFCALPTGDNTLIIQVRVHDDELSACLTVFEFANGEDPIPVRRVPAYVRQTEI